MASGLLYKGPLIEMELEGGKPGGVKACICGALAGRAFPYGPVYSVPMPGWAAPPVAAWLMGGPDQPRRICTVARTTSMSLGRYLEEGSSGSASTKQIEHFGALHQSPMP
eukprot:186835-Pelagomonas_calceolata.AAC.2